jgi:hypothetical protein
MSVPDLSSSGLPEHVKHGFEEIEFEARNTRNRVRTSCSSPVPGFRDLDSIILIVELTFATNCLKTVPMCNDTSARNSPA